MIEIEIVKTPTGIRGATEEDEKKYRKFREFITTLENGEIARVGYVKPRNPKFHRKFFVLLGIAFDAWEPRRKKFKGMPVQKNFERFRKDVTIAAGFYDLVATRNGGVRHEAKSIAFDNMDDDEFHKVYNAVSQVLIDGVLTTKGYRKEDVDDVVEKILALDFLILQQEIAR